jgi:FdhD protein
MQDRSFAGMEQCDIFIYGDKGISVESVPIIREVSLGIFLDGIEMVSIACNGNYLRELAVGFLRSEGFIGTASDIKRIDMSDDGGAVHIFTKDAIPQQKRQPCEPDTIASSGSRGWKRENKAQRREDLSARKIFISVKNVFNLMKRFVDLSRLHQVTGGTHSAALAHGDRILTVREDIGRHNTIDMLGGYAVLKGIDCSDKIILRTGRVSAEIVHKVWNLEIPVMISLSVPTSMAVQLCREAGITLIGSVRGEKMKVYSHEWRIEH